MSATSVDGRHARMDALAASLMVLLCLVWGLQQVAIKVAMVDGFPPLLQGAFRSFGAALLTWGWSLRHRPPTRRAFPRFPGPELLLASLFGTEFVLIYLGLRFTSASRAVLFLYTTPLFVAVGAHALIPGERLTARRLLGLGCAFCGMCVAVADGMTGRFLTTAIYGDLLEVGGAVLWASTTLLIRHSTVLSHTPPARILLIQLGGSVPFLLAASWALGERLVPGAFTALTLASLGYQMIVVAFVSYLVWFWLVAHYPAGRLSSFTFLTPIFGMAAGAWLLQEAISPLLGAALLCIVLGLWLQNR